MVVKKVSEKLASCYGTERANKMAYIATNNGTIESGYANGETAEEAIENLKKQNALNMGSKKMTIEEATRYESRI
jgi:hypothetical protein